MQSQMLPKLLIVTPFILPVPNVYGGAIESTIQIIIDHNEKNKRVCIDVISPLFFKAYLASKKYKYTRFIWIPNGFFYKIFNFPFRFFGKFTNAQHLDMYLTRWIAKRYNYSKVIVHGNARFLLCILEISERNYYFVHSSVKNCEDILTIKALSRANKIITISKFIKNQIEELTNKTNVSVLQNTIGDEFFNKKINNYSTPRSSEVILLFVGRIVKEKGLLELLEALLDLKTNIDYRLDIIGSFGSNFGRNTKDDIYSRKIKILVSKLGQKAKLLGYIPNNGLLKYLDNSDILVMPSIGEEGAGKSAIEGMAAGLPVIATKNGGIPEYVSEECGILINNDSNLIENLTISIKLLLENVTLRLELGNNARLHAQRFAPANYYYKYLEM